MSLIHLRKHGKDCVLVDRGGRQAECWKAGHFYEEDLLENIYLQVMMGDIPRGLAIDVGASIGNHTIWLAQVCGFPAVLAFEPMEGEALEENVNANKLGRIVDVHRIGLGARQGFFARGAKGSIDLTNPGQLPVMTLDDFSRSPLAPSFFPRVTLIKIDVEWMEPAVLRGARELITRDQPAIFTEVHDGTLREQRDILAPLGYQELHRFNVKPNVAPVIQWTYRSSP